MNSISETSPEPIYRWVIVSASALMLALSMGMIVNGTSVFFIPLFDEFGWQRGDWRASTSTLRVGHMEGYDGTKSPYFDTNLSIRYDLTQDSYIGFTVTNIFDSIPDSDSAYDNGSSFYPYGFNSFRYPRFGPQAYLAYQLRF